jgi:tetratricopeptide (TPR) repeat protein
MQPLERILHLYIKFLIMRLLFVLLFFISCHGFAQNLQQGIKLYNEQKFDASIKALQGISKDNKDFGEAQYYSGMCLMAKNDYEKASNHFEKAVKTNDNNAEYHYMLGASYGMIAKNANVVKQGYLASKIKSEFEKAAELNPKHIESREALVQFYIQAPSFMGGSEEKALKVADEIKKIDKQQGYFIKGSIYIRQKKFDLAEKEYESGYRLNPDSLNSQLTLIYAYISCMKTDKAFELIENLIVKKPERKYQYFYQYGKVSAITGKKASRGIEYLKNYILQYVPEKDEPSHSYAYYRIGMIYEQLKNKEEAKRNYTLALKSDSENKDAAKALEKIKSSQ